VTEKLTRDEALQKIRNWAKTDGMCGDKVSEERWTAIADALDGTVVDIGEWVTHQAHPDAPYLIDAEDGTPIHWSHSFDMAVAPHLTEGARYHVSVVLRRIP
jgi:hypothetical protein